MALKHDIFAPPGAMAMPTDPVSVLSTADESVLQTDAYERLPDQTNSGEMTWSATTDSKSILVFDAVPCGMQSFKLSYGQTCRRYRHKLTGNNYLVGGETQGKFCCSGPTVGDYSHAVIDTLLVVSEPGQRATYRLKGFKLTDDPAQTGKLFAVFSGLEVLG